MAGGSSATIAHREPCRRGYIDSAIAKVTGVRLHDCGCRLRAHKSRVVEQVQASPEVSKAITALVLWLGVKIVEVPAEHLEGAAGRSRYSYWRLIRMNFDLSTGFRTGTLEFVSIASLPRTAQCPQCLARGRRGVP